jgi:hypothetical protein
LFRIPDRCTGFDERAVSQTAVIGILHPLFGREGRL